MTTVESILLATRPSMPAAADAPPATPMTVATVWTAMAVARAKAYEYAQAQPAVVALPRDLVLTATEFWFDGKGGTTNKINNVIGTGTIQSAPVASAMREHQVQLDKIKGGDARGVPPRGRPV